MESSTTPLSDVPSPLAALRRFTRPRPPREVCELCSAPLSSEHRHLLQFPVRQILCACDACSILFTSDHSKNLRCIPRRIEYWSDFQLSDEHWAGLGVPIALAFFFHSTPHNQIIAMYPSPAGPAEAQLPDEAWQTLVAVNPALQSLDPDVEALLVYRVAGIREYYRAPIDECFKLVGLIRMHWRGISGGAEVWNQIRLFFNDLNTRSTTTTAHA